MTNFVLSLVRTWVPVGVGAFAAWLLTLGVELDEATRNGLVVALTGVIIAAYYALARLLEKKWPSAGILLGSTKQPEYFTPPVAEHTAETPADTNATVRNFKQF